MYSTPELLLVGAAQNLVMGDSLNQLATTPGCAPDNIVDGNPSPYEDVAGW